MSDCSTHAFDVPLKPCPFCSAEPEVLSDGRRTWGLVQHNEGCLLPVYPKHEIPASDFTAWNTRHQCGLTDEDYNILLDELGVSERTCSLEGFADVLFNVDYEVNGYDTSSGKDYATLAECSECNAYVIVPPAHHHVLTCDGDEIYQPYNYCPNCGAKVVGE